MMLIRDVDASLDTKEVPTKSSTINFSIGFSSWIKKFGFRSSYYLNSASFFFRVRGRYIIQSWQWLDLFLGFISSPKELLCISHFKTKRRRSFSAIVSYSFLPCRKKRGSIAQFVSKRLFVDVPWRRHYVRKRTTTIGRWYFCVVTLKNGKDSVQFSLALLCFFKFNSFLTQEFSMFSLFKSFQLFFF